MQKPDNPPYVLNLLLDDLYFEAIILDVEISKVLFQSSSDFKVRT